MGARSITGGTNLASGGYFGGSATFFVSLIQCAPQGSTSVTEAESAQTCRQAATLRNLSIYVKTNGRGDTTTITSRKNGAAGNQSISLGAGVTGHVQDTTHSDSLSAGDTFNVRIVMGAGSGIANITAIYAELESSANVAHTYFGIVRSSGQALSVSAASTTSTVCPVGGPQSSTASGREKISLAHAGTIQNFQVYVTSNARTTNTTCGVNKNGSAGNNVVTIGNAATGLFEDTTHTDTFSASDQLGYYCTTGTGSGTLAIARMGCMFVSADTDFPLLATDTASTTKSSSSAYALYPFGAMSISAGNTAADAVVKSLFAATLSHMQIRVSSTTTNTLIVKSKKNGADGNQSLSIASGSTGLFEDTTHTDTLASGDTYGLGFDANTAVAPLQGWAFRMAGPSVRGGVRSTLVITG